MKKIFFLVFVLASSQFLFSQEFRANPWDCNVKFWIDLQNNRLYANSDIDSLQKTYQVMVIKDSIVGIDTVFFTFEKKLLSDVKKEEEEWRNNIIGKRLLDFEMKDINGNMINNNLFSDNYIIADFSSFYCGPCLKEIPGLNKLSDSLKMKNVKIISFFNEDTTAMNEMFSNPVIVEKLLGGKKVHFTYTVIPNAKTIIDSYKIYAFPTHLIIDNQGVVRNIIVGLPHDDITKEITLVETMLKELKAIGL